MKRSNSPGYRKISEYYEHLIYSGRLKPGQALPTEPELAKQHGTTRTTLRRAFAILVNKGLVHKTAGRGTFVASATELDGRRQRHVAVVAPQSFVQSRGSQRSGFAVGGRSGYYQLLEAITSALSEHGRTVRLYYVGEEVSDYQEVAESITAGGGIGIVVMEASCEPCIGVLAQTGLPTVCVDSIVASTRADIVNGDDRGGCREATLHLLRTTKGPVAFLGADETDPRRPHRLRFEGFLDAHQEIGRRFDERYFLGVRAVLPSSGRSAAKDVLAMSVPPVGVVCSDDALAFGLMQILRQTGVAVPSEMSVIGFGNTVFTLMLIPPISSVAPNRVAMGERAVALLEERLSSPGRRPKTLFIPTRLILRQSTMPLANPDILVPETAAGS